MRPVLYWKYHRVHDISYQKYMFRASHKSCTFPLHFLHQETPSSYASTEEIATLLKQISKQETHTTNVGSDKERISIGDYDMSPRLKWHL